MTQWQKITYAFASLALASGIVLSAAAPALAQAPTEQQILDALKSAPEPKSRGLTLNQSRQKDEEQRFIDRIRTKTRGLSADERQRVAEIAKGKPNIDLEVYFDYDSSAITPRAESDLMTLGRALTNSEVSGNVFLVGGHTDAKGDNDYNPEAIRAARSLGEAVLEAEIRHFGRHPGGRRLRRRAAEEHL